MSSCPKRGSAQRNCCYGWMASNNATKGPDVPMKNAALPSVVTPPAYLHNRRCNTRGVSRGFCLGNDDMIFVGVGAAAPSAYLVRGTFCLGKPLGHARGSVLACLFALLAEPSGDDVGSAGFEITDLLPGFSGKETLKLLTTPEKYGRVMVYGTLATACIVSLVVALAIPDKLVIVESQIAAIYLTFLIGSNKAFNAKSVFGSRILGAIMMFIGTGLLPATIIHVAIAQIEPDQSAHAGTLVGYAIVAVLAALFVAPFSWCAVKGWRCWEEKCRRSEIGTVVKA